MMRSAAETAVMTPDGDRALRGFEATVRLRRLFVLWFLVFFCFFALYALTAQRGCSWQDSGWYQWRVFRGVYQGDAGICTSHPLYIAMGRFWVSALSFADPCWALNCFSGVGTALGVANLGLLLTLLTRNVTVSILVAALLGVSHTPWWLSTAAEVYTWSAAGLTIELLLLFRFFSRPQMRVMTILALVNGLGLSIHNFALLSLPIYAMVAILHVIETRRNPWVLAVPAVAYLAGASPVLVQVVEMAVKQGSILEAIQSALVGAWGASVTSSRLRWSVLAPNAALVSLNLILVLLPFVWVGLTRMGRLGWRVPAALGTIFAIHLVFFIRYDVMDLFTFALPTLVMIATIGGYGAAMLAAESPRAHRLVTGMLGLCILACPLLYGAIPAILKATGISTQRADWRGLRNETRYWVVPWKHTEHSAQSFALAALQTAAPSGVVLVSRQPMLYPLILTRDREPTFRDVVVMSAGKEQGWLETCMRKNIDRDVFIAGPMTGVRGADTIDTKPAGMLRRGVLRDGRAATGRTP